MAVTWTTEQVLALAPDEASAKAGRGLASARKWISLGSNERALWGVFQGSAQAPYQTAVDLLEPGFHCTCPSRKLPCKHSLGLFLLSTEQNAAFDARTAPDWVTEWLVKRDELAARRAKPASRHNGTTPAPETPAPSRRSTQREDRVAAGMQELERWLRDLARLGLAHAQTQPPHYWENIAARMVDAQAPGIARWLRAMANLPTYAEGWASLLLERVGLLHLLVESYQRIEQLSNASQADVRTAIGFNLRQEDVLATAGMRDTWMVLGQHAYEEERLRVQRTWLQGKRTARAALLLEYAFGNQMLDASVMPGTQFDAELAFYPGGFPLRAVVKRRLSDVIPLAGLPAHPDHTTALAAYTRALACNPWLELFPMGVEALIPLYHGEQWHVRDATARTLPLSTAFTGGWQLVAVSGGRPVTLFGQWDGHAFHPLSAWAEGRFARF